jgi:hypothetical protein
MCASLSSFPQRNEVEWSSGQVATGLSCLERFYWSRLAAAEWKSGVQEKLVKHPKRGSVMDASHQIWPKGETCRLIRGFSWARGDPSSSVCSMEV